MLTSSCKYEQVAKDLKTATTDAFTPSTQL